MIGLPTETLEDIDGIKEMSEIAKDLFFKRPKEEIRGDFQVTLSSSCFVPKPFTPFQWARMDSSEEFLEKQRFLNRKMKEQINYKSIKYNWHEVELTMIEGVLARGDRRLSKVIMDAYQAGCIYDSWSEYFKYDEWIKAFEVNGIDPLFYTCREREEDELFPWDYINVGVTKDFLLREYKRAKEGKVTPNCRQACVNCGAKVYDGGVCYEG